MSTEARSVYVKAPAEMEARIRKHLASKELGRVTRELAGQAETDRRQVEAERRQAEARSRDLAAVAKAAQAYGEVFYSAYAAWTGVPAHSLRRRA